MLPSFCCRVLQQTGQIVSMPLARVVGQLVPDRAEHGARGLAGGFVVPEVLGDRFARAQAGVPGAQCGQCRRIGKTFGLDRGLGTFHNRQFSRATQPLR